MTWAKGYTPGRYVRPRTDPSHGTVTRYRYRACRCEPCRAADVEYRRALRQRLRRGAGDYFANAQLARDHLIYLREQSVGYRTVAEVTGINTCLLQSITRGTRRRIRESTERRILQVTTEARSDNSLIDATLTQCKIRQAIKERNCSVFKLGKLIGFEIQFMRRKQIRARTALRVEKALKRINSESQIEHMFNLAGKAKRAA